MTMKRESLASQLKDLKRMTEASKQRQEGKNITSEDIKKKEEEKPKGESKSATTKTSPNGKPYYGPAYGEAKASGKSSDNTRKAPSKASRRPTGREEMIAQRFLERRKKESNVVS